MNLFQVQKKNFLNIMIDLSGCEKLFRDKDFMNKINNSRARMYANILSGIEKHIQSGKKINKSEILRKLLDGSYQELVKQLEKILLKLKPDKLKKVKEIYLLSRYSNDNYVQADDILIDTSIFKTFMKDNNMYMSRIIEPAVIECCKNYFWDNFDNFDILKYKINEFGKSDSKGFGVEYVYAELLGLEKHQGKFINEMSFIKNIKKPSKVDRRIEMEYGISFN